MTETGESGRLSAVGWWGIAGVVGLLVQAIVGMVPVAMEAVSGIGVAEGTVMAAWIVVAGYAEGYRAFQKQFAPRVVARAQYLSARASVGHAILAPVVCMGLVHATRKRLLVSWAVTAGVVGLVLVVRELPQPWRGVIDAGVVIALAWGVGAIVHFAMRASAGEQMPVKSDVPS